jgi:hypothetical protein
VNVSTGPAELLTSRIFVPYPGTNASLLLLLLAAQEALQLGGELIA